MDAGDAPSTSIPRGETWKQFFIGFGIPGIFMALPFILLAIPQGWDQSQVIDYGLSGLGCVGIPLLGSGMVIFGFNTGRRATSIGAWVALAAYPFWIIYVYGLAMIQP